MENSRDLHMAQHVLVRFRGASAPGYIEGITPDVALVHLYDVPRRVAVPYDDVVATEHERIASRAQLAALGEALRIAKTGEFPDGVTIGYATVASVLA